MFLFIVLSCIGWVCAMDINESDDSSVTTTSSSNKDMEQDSTEEIYDNNGEFIPDNNFEDGYENSEIIKLNDDTQYLNEEGGELVEDSDSGEVIQHIPS